ncbi:MAG: 2-C-methyl-D-erythritol 4-phosphate cytidylyltransferase [Duncaniella sp.]|nr:2-C-methyl-D-erythritol 4-phosphate cytidylyltransferase [Duncaniella sp.]
MTISLDTYMIHYPDTHRNVHIVVAAGSGSRYGGDLPKQFCDLWGRPMLMTTLERLDRAAPGARMIVVLSEPMVDMWRDMCREHGFTLPHDIVIGGPSRAHSVQNAVRTLDAGTTGWVSVHDAARPMVTPAMMGRLLDALDDTHPGAIPTVAVTDSLRMLTSAGSSVAVDRSLYRAVQTPQVFDGATIISANRQEILPVFTDDASVVEAAGFGPLALVEGDTANIKVTNPGDIESIGKKL